MAPGSLTNAFSDRDAPLSKTVGLMSEMGKMSNGPFAAQIFGNGGEESVHSCALLPSRALTVGTRRYCEKYGATREHLAKIASKSHRHSVNNPYAQFHHGKSAEEVLQDQKVTNFLTR